ncbi:MAG TPA: hypothetical protein VLB67_00310, partial [Acidimicrobiia bacterium]|nr:hypothetical protein [Acidimicrobiia bacterium]
MRQVAMFVVGFAVVAAAGVAATQMAVVAGSGPASPHWAPEKPVSAPAGADARPPDREAVTAAPRTEPPSEDEGLTLEIHDPQDGLRTDAVEVVLTGRTSPGAHVWSGEHVAVVDPEGGWSLTVPLVRGKNVLFVGALRGDLTTTVTTTIIQGEELVWAIHQKVRASETP